MGYPEGVFQSPFDLVVIAASLGGPEAVRQLVAALPADFPAAVLVVQHRVPRLPDVTVELLAKRSRLTVCLAQEGNRPSRGTVYVAPADRGLRLAPGWHFDSLPSPRPNSHPADVLLASVADQAGKRAIAVILSGTNDDGAAGVVALKRRGGRVLVQDRATARCFTMPAAAIATGCVDFILPLDQLAPALVTLTMVPGAAELFRVALPPWAQAAS